MFRLTTLITIPLCIAIGLLAEPATGRAAELAMGFRVGEVTQDSAIVWSRVTKHPTANRNGVVPDKVRTKRVEKYTPSRIAIADRLGAVPGADGQLRLLLSESPDFKNPRVFDWVTVRPEHDYTHQFQLDNLKPATCYHLRVEARPAQDADVSATHHGSFRTPAAADTWQDVSFGVVTGQYFHHLDHPDGFHIYPAMQRAGIDFLIPTGDTVYYDSEEPRARTLALARFHWHRMYSLPRHVELHRRVAVYFEKDDHDTFSDDCYPTIDSKWMHPFSFAQGLQVFREQVPMGEKTYRTIRWGRGLQIWLVEGRDFRSANTDPDGPEKTIWGKEQLQWLQQTILASDADFRVLISPTPIVGPDRSTKADNHSNKTFAYEGNYFRNWTKEQGLQNFYVCCGDRHWQYMSVDPKTGLREFSCGPASDEHAGGTPGHDMKIQPFHRVKGGFLSVSVTGESNRPRIAFRHHDVHGDVVHEFTATSKR